MTLGTRETLAFLAALALLCGGFGLFARSPRLMLTAAALVALASIVAGAALFAYAMHGLPHPETR